MKRTFLATFLSIVFAMVAVACHSSDEKEIGSGLFLGLRPPGDFDFTGRGVCCKITSVPAWQVRPACGVGPSGRKRTG